MNEIKNIPDGWKEDNLIDYLESLIDYRGKTPKKSESGILTLSAKSVKMGYIDYSQAYYISKETYDKFMVRGFPKIGDVLMTTEAPLGCIAKLDRDDVAVAQRLLTIRGKKNQLDNEYLRYYLTSRLGQHELQSRASGTTVEGIKRSEFIKVKILLPKYEEQKAIASILNAFDDKIELLQAQNRTLEATAQTIFAEWFGKYSIDDELPSGWRIGTLGNEFDITIGRTPPRIEQEWFSNIPTGKKWISIKDIGNSGTYIFNTSEFLTDEAIKKFNIPIIPENTTILSFKMTVGKLTITTEDMLSNEAIAHLKLKAYTALSTEFIYLYLQNLDFNALGSTSSIVTAINSTMIKAIEVIIPNKVILLNFDEAIKPLFDKIKLNTEQIQNLTKTRDELLPRLMSGEVRVKM